MRLLVLGCLLLAGSLLLPGWLLLAPADQGFPADRGRSVTAPPLVAVDSSGNDNDGVIQGSPKVGLPGHDGTSYSFDRHGSWVRVPSAPSLNPKKRDFLLSAWVRFEVGPRNGATYDVVRKGLSYTHTGEYKLEILDGGRVKCSAKDSRHREARVVGTAVDVTNGGWHYVGCARVGSTWNVLVDESVESTPAALGAVGNALPLSIGSKYGLEDAPHGRVDDVRLLIDEPAGRRSGSGGSTLGEAITRLSGAEPVAWWRLDETMQADPLVS